MGGIGQALEGPRKHGRIERHQVRRLEQRGYSVSLKPMTA
jgi:hypothetical protein